ncbi:MAG: DinB family protein [Chloroflexi bacterium]|nr:DinB family protein [Chloroflexota bacterium]
MMSLRKQIMHRAGKLLMEPPASQTIAEQVAALEASGRTIRERADQRGDSTANRSTLGHVIGIERWGQRRICLALGEACDVGEEYDGYRPPLDTEWEALKQMFNDTRAETVRIARQIEDSGVRPTFTIRHNTFGPLTVRGWLRYLNVHSSAESRRLR